MRIETHLKQLRAEREAFDRQLPALLDTHLGRWALFADGHPIGFFDGYGIAFSVGLALYGRERVFLVAKVQDPPWRLLGLEVADLLSAA